MTAAETVRQRLKDAGIKPADLARALGVTPQLAGQMIKEKDPAGIPIWYLEPIAVLLKMTVPDLVRPISEPTGQDVGRSELHSLAQSRVGLAGTESADRQVPPHSTDDGEPYLDARSRIARETRASGALLKAAAQLSETSERLSRLASELLPPAPLQRTGTTGGPPATPRHPVRPPSGRSPKKR